MYSQLACCSGSYLVLLLLGLHCVFLLGLSCIVTAWFKWSIVIGITLYRYYLGLACVLLLGLPCIVTAWITLCVFICVALVYLAVVGIACCLGSN